MRREGGSIIRIQLPVNYGKQVCKRVHTFGTPGVPYGEDALHGELHECEGNYETADDAPLIFHE